MNDAAACAPVSPPDPEAELLGYATQLIAACARNTKARGLNDIKSVPSPCISVCRVDADSGWCDGCLRTLDEIAAWGGLDNAARLDVWRTLNQRAVRRVRALTTPSDEKP
ncbi:MAG: hypothetical protein B7X59_06760 [Polaromonas sp. 39-63-203]|nr:MAG: hypothetical protein B7Y54_04750 [Polaromonas sp. 35-63-240]OYY99422.1 MAG: hypothetical protein B7Y42_05905 [Polaromonas sp. 28-63-22]OYZ84189.1 MAG: hypothetical protein B7Y03_05090 [Polaromonas sp. 24-62-144]OZA98055.1 MAG: hypothetical protein B7X59_06760 [Polaromonas sp. 39-63-203]